MNDSLHNVIANIIEHFGLHILLEGKKFCSFIADAVPTMYEEQKIIRLIDEKDLFSQIYILLSNHGTAKQLKDILESAGFPNSWITIILEAFGFSCGVVLEEYETVSKLIDFEKEKNMDRLVSAIAAISLRENGETELVSENDSNTFLRDNDEDIAIVSLLSLRIKAGCALVRDGFIEKKKQLKEDIEKLISSVQTIEYEWSLSDNVRSDAYDLLVAICPETYKAILVENYHWNLENVVRGNITNEMYMLFINIASYLERLKRTEDSHRLLEMLCMYSRRRNNIDLHKEIVCKVISNLSTNDPETICRIASIDGKIFENDISAYAGDFYWFYGCSLQNLNDPTAAAPVFEKCYQIRKVLFGDLKWFTAVARREYAICVFATSKGHNGKEELQNFVDNIEAGLFDQDVDKQQLQIIEAKTLYPMLMDLSDIDNPDEFKKYLKIYGRLCKTYGTLGEPYISMRLVWNLRAGYYMRIGDYIQAESAFLNALKVNEADNSTCVLSTAQIKSNLLMIYCIQNDIENAYTIIEELLDLIDSDNPNSGLKESDEYRIYTILISLDMQVMIESEQEKILDVKSFLDATCADILKACNISSAREKAIFTIICIFYLLQQEASIITEQKKYFKVLECIEYNNNIFDLAPMQYTLLYYCEALLLWNIGDVKSEIYFKKLIHNIDNNNVQNTQKAAIFQSYAAFLFRKGESDTGIQYIEKSLEKITEIWHDYVRYLNDTRLIMILTPTQLTFAGCYTILRQLPDVEIAYQQLLRFKALASLAGRERNRIMRRSKFDPDLLSKIQKLQNTIAVLESENMLRDVEKEYDELEKEQRRLEKDFAKQFPKKVEFTDITLEAVKNAIPDNSVVLEYFLTANSYGRTQFELDDKDENFSTIDIYVTTKSQGICHLQRITVSNGIEIMENAKQFVLVLQHISDNTVSVDELEQMEQVRIKLYNTLILPILQFIEEYKTVYIAPDNELINLPFDILYNESKIRLADRHNCVKIECARDFLFNVPWTSSNKQTLIIGNPEFEVKERFFEPDQIIGKDNSLERTFNLYPDNINPLPFAEIETYRISKRICAKLYTGVGAKKDIFLNANGYENVHVATHGYFDIKSESASLYSSCLVFAGVKNWLRTGKSSSIYGNGIVTADEVSRMDLSSTELVVLSSCLSGMNDVLFNTGFYGMISALSAAGVKFVISNLWNANDFATAIFMDAFYYYYVNEENTPPDALNKARNYLRKVTIEQLREQGWFSVATYQMLDPMSRQFMTDLEKRNGKLRPFKNESFWGGFVCYECN